MEHSNTQERNDADNVETANLEHTNLGEVAMVDAADHKNGHGASHASPNSTDDAPATSNRARSGTNSRRRSAAKPKPLKPSGPLPPLNNPDLYLNREMSWLAFNDRVFGEARDLRHPLLERVKFVAIGHSNLDEYYMIRVSGLQQQVAAGMTDISLDGRTSSEQLEMLRQRVGPMLQDAADYFRESLSPELSANGIEICSYKELSRLEQSALRDYYNAEIFPVLTPLALGPGHPFPHISNLSLNLAVVVRDPVIGEKFARMKVPGVLPRLLPVPCEQPYEGRQKFVWIEQVIAANLRPLFPGLQVVDSHPFRVTRDADIEIQDDEASDLLHTVEEGLQRRHFGDVCRLEITDAMPPRLRDMLIDNLLVDRDDVYAINGPLGLSDLMQLMKQDRPDIKDPPLIPGIPAELNNKNNLLDTIGEQDVLVHHPYDSFAPVLDFVESAAKDSSVLAIKQTLYRVGSNSPMVRSLAEARDDDTQVAVLVELKARFDEENNIEWARALEDAGVHVVYGLVGLKTHCKVALIVRRERDGKLKRYVHLGTGNYNPVTARIYTDMSLFTARPDICADVSELFNRLTGYSYQESYRKLLVAPVNMRNRLLEMIEREAEHARQGRTARLILKTNTLSDEPVIKALYTAAHAGVKIDLIVRGVCCIVPGVPGLSENIRVLSLVGRFLEHSRIYYFQNGGNFQIYLGSADLMRRNLDRRIEILFPVENKEIRKHLRDEVLEIYLRDNVDTHELQADGEYRRLAPANGAEPFSAQTWFLEQRGAGLQQSNMGQ